MTYTIWEFKTARFTVRVTAETEYDIDLSWDDDGTVTEQIASGELEIFCAKAAVYLDGNEVAVSYLGNCIYESANQFGEMHRDKNPLNRNCSLMQQERGENISICHYFPNMVRTACLEARKSISAYDPPKLRAVT